jgi:hypothetical protein
MGRSLATVIAAVDAATPIRGRGLWSAEDLAYAKGKLRALMDATVSVRVGRDADGRIQYAEMPDNGIQLAATIKFMEFELGKAPQTIEVSHHGTGDEAKPKDPLEMLRNNPALMRTMLEQYLGVIKMAQSPLVHDLEPRHPQSTTENESGKRQR